MKIKTTMFLLIIGSFTLAGCGNAGNTHQFPTRADVISLNQACKIEALKTARHQVVDTSMVVYVESIDAGGGGSCIASWLEDYPGNEKRRIESRLYLAANNTNSDSVLSRH